MSNLNITIPLHARRINSTVVRVNFIFEVVLPTLVAKSVLAREGEFCVRGEVLVADATVVHVICGERGYTVWKLLLQIRIDLETELVLELLTLIKPVVFDLLLVPFVMTCNDDHWVNTFKAKNVNHAIYLAHE